MPCVSGIKLYFSVPNVYWNTFFKVNLKYVLKQMPFFFCFNGGYSELGSTHRLSDDARRPKTAAWTRHPGSGGSRAEQKVVGKGGGGVGGTGPGPAQERGYLHRVVQDPERWAENLY